MADISRHPGGEPHFRPKLTYQCVAREMRNWRLRTLNLFEPKQLELFEEVG